jgi:hypothetical protein
MYVAARFRRTRHEAGIAMEGNHFQDSSGACHYFGARLALSWVIQWAKCAYASITR